MNLVITHHWLKECIRLRRERLLLGAKGTAQQATINTVSAQQSIKAAGASAVTAVHWCFPEMTTPCKM